MASIEIDLNALRRIRGLSQEQLADAAGIARTTLRRKINKPGTFTIDEAAGISAALNIQPNEWLGAAS